MRRAEARPGERPSSCQWVSLGASAGERIAADWPLNSSLAGGSLAASVETLSAAASG